MIYYFLIIAIILSFLGWAYESSICSLINEKRLINRGFMIGPICPIYGIGAIACYLIGHRITSVFLLFTISSIMCSILEYVTSFILEKLFHDKWWDYSMMKFQIQGRVCLAGAILFGTGNTVLIRYIIPDMLNLLQGADPLLIQITATVFTTLFCLDLLLTGFHWTQLNLKLSLLHDYLTTKANNMTDTADAMLKTYTPVIVSETFEGFLVKIDNLHLTFQHPEIHFLHAFPHIQAKPVELIKNKSQQIKEILCK